MQPWLRLTLDLAVAKAPGPAAALLLGVQRGQHVGGVAALVDQLAHPLRQGGGRGETGVKRREPEAASEM